MTKKWRGLLHALSIFFSEIAPFLVCGNLEYQISDPRLQASYFLPGDNEIVLRKKTKKEKRRRTWFRNTRVGEYFVTTRTVPWTSYRRAFSVCKPRRVYFILFNFYSWAIRGILETWSCQSAKVREKKWKKKTTEFCLPFFVVLL